MRTLAVLVGFLVVSAGCGAGGGAGDDDDDAIDGGPGDRVDAAFGVAHTVTWGPVTVAPLQEDTRCVVKRLGNAGEIRVGRIHNELGSASHHLIVYRLASGTVREEPFACDPFQDVLDPSQGAPLAVTQVKDETITLPPGVAFTLADDQLVRLELHYINAGAEPVEVAATTTFVEIPDADFTDEADFLFIGNPDISIPAHAARTVGPSFLPLPPELTNIKFFALTGHEHRYGTGVTVERLDTEAGEAVTVYDPPSFKWDEPPTIYHDPPFEIAGGGGFRFTCTFMNTGDQPVGFGESANDEMCFFWAYYYPSNGAKVCFHTEQYGGHDICCPGDALCSLIDDFLNGA